VPPVTVLTSNRTRDLHDALKRRCLYHWISYPDTPRVAEIIRRRAPASGDRLSGQVAAAVHRLRGLDLTKPPGISEAISWAGALSVFGADELSAPMADQTMSTVLKYPEDEDLVRQAGLATVLRPGRSRRHGLGPVGPTWRRWRPGSVPPCTRPGSRSGLIAANGWPGPSPSWGSARWPSCAPAPWPRSFPIPVR
jgi:hypothetical protein